MRPPANEPSSLVRHLRNFQFFGFIILRIDPPSYSKLSAVRFLLSALYCVLNFGVQLQYYVLLDYKASSAESSISVVLRTVNRLCQILAPPLLVFGAWYKRFDFEQAINTLFAVQRSVGIPQYRLFVAMKFALSFFGLDIIRQVAMSVYACQTLHIYPSESVCYEMKLAATAFYVFIFSSVLPFIYLTRCVGACFAKLPEMKLAYKTNEVASVEDFIRTFDHITEVALRLNSIYTAAISNVVLLVFLVSLRTTANIFSDELSSWQESVSKSMLLVGPVFALIFVIDTCQLVSDQEQTCHNVLLNHLIHHKNENALQNTRVVAHFVGKKRLQFNAFRCIIINYQFLISIVTALVTYAIILYQMKKKNS